MMAIIMHEEVQPIRHVDFFFFTAAKNVKYSGERDFNALV